MGSSQNYVCCHRNRHLIFSLLFLLASGLTQVRFMAEGRAISKLVEAAQKGFEAEKMVVMTSMIGSRPPKCERRCSSCTHCEAVQVPVATQAVGHKRSHFSAVAYSRGDDISNYKPMSWKCKCGNLIFDP
ncbi:EPIDERMAL PATTERNING FACTOR-like protein 2 [Melia azedarach]|uniref:EPIDERMAL PATTERNING FACTOR-like protein 2 n=1 Tax=Melia azedarach TaxID=155640 RepID=A0ACC1WUH1_MELAZ|nr:EPIDERMAL PATTERNING FACTOR-like protein 2 [Melia azedarach]